MHTFIKSCVSVTTAGFLMTSVFAHAADSSKEKAEDPVKKCQSECKSNQDNELYEACMLKCKETHKSARPAVPARKK